MAAQPKERSQKQLGNATDAERAGGTRRPPCGNDLESRVNSVTRRSNLRRVKSRRPIADSGYAFTSVSKIQEKNMTRVLKIRRRNIDRRS